MNTKLIFLSLSAAVLISACATTGPATTQSRDSMTSTEYDSIEVMPTRKLTDSESAIVSDKEVEDDMRKKIALSRLDGNEISCRKFVKTGTRLGAKRVCKTRIEWAKIKDDAKAAMDDLQGRPQITPEL